MNLKKGVTIVGSGNVAWHFAHKIKNAGININKVFGRTENNTAELAKSIGVEWSVSLKDITIVTDLVLICVSDNSIVDVARELAHKQLPIAHTAGSVPLSVLHEFTAKAGVFYPFQTLSKWANPGEVDIPVCIEANGDEIKTTLVALANKISKKVFELDSGQRKKLHLSGVVANNFSNFLFLEAFKFLEVNNMPSELLEPIILQTAKQIQVEHPEIVQTGPARRGSQAIIDEHIKMLESLPDLKEIYALLSNKIMNFYKNVNG